MERERTKEEIDAAHELADYHMTEIIEGLIPEVDELRDSLRSEIRRRLVDAFLEGILWREQN